MRGVRRAALTCIALLVVASLAAPADAEEPAREPRRWLVVVSASWRGPAAVDVATLRRIYLGEQTELAGRRVRPLHLPLGSAERERFSDAVLGRNADELERYWIAEALQGGALPPREVRDAAALLRALRGDDRAIGYVAPDALAGEAGEGIRVLDVMGSRR